MFVLSLVIWNIPKTLNSYWLPCFQKVSKYSQEAGYFALHKLPAMVYNRQNEKKKKHKLIDSQFVRLLSAVGKLDLF